MGSVRYDLAILGEECRVTVIQTSKTVWKASGSIKGQFLSFKGRSENLALSKWKSAAHHVRACN
jgi:hypothetical protein